MVLRRREEIAPQVRVSVSQLPNGSGIFDQLGHFGEREEGAMYCHADVD